MGVLVPVGLDCCQPSTSGLSTRSSSGRLMGTTYLWAGFPLRCFQRLSVRSIATLRCHGCDNRNTRGSYFPILSY